MKDLAQLQRARREGTLNSHLRDLAKRQKDDDYARRELAFLSPHLTQEEMDYCRQVEQEQDE
jgi:hypothetical protein